MKNKYNRIWLSAMRTFLLILLLLFTIINISYAAFTELRTFTDSTELYALATQVDEFKTGLDGTDTYLPPGGSAKIEFIIPPGVDFFYISDMAVSNWSEDGKMLYGHSFYDYPNAESYTLMTSTGYSAYWVTPVETPDLGELAVGDQPNPRNAYLIIHNTSPFSWSTGRINIRMKVHDVTAYNNWVNEGGATTPLPTAPTNLTYTETQTSIALNWDDSPDETGYRIKENGTTITNGTLPQNSTTITISNLEISSAHTYQVCAYNDGGEACSSFSTINTLSLNVPDALDSFTESNVEKTSLKLNWTYSSNNELGFRLYNGLGGLIDGNIGMAVRAKDITGLTSDTAYQYSLCPYNNDGNGPCSVLSVTTPAILIPTTPDALTASESTKDSITLTWNDNASNENGYQLYRDGVIIVNDIAADTELKTDTGLSVGTKYAYKVCAYNDDGTSCSEYIFPITDGFQGPILGEPVITKNSVTLHWTDNSNSEIGYRIKRNGITVKDDLPPWVGTGSTTSQTDEGLDSDTSYLYSICAFDSDDNEACSLLPVRTIPPENPTDLIVTEVTTTAITFQWSDNSDGLLGHEAKCSTRPSALLDAGMTNYQFTGLTLGETYYCQVCAYNDDEDFCSPIIPITTASLEIPTDLTATDVTKNSVILNWTDNAAAPDNETSYQIKRNGVTLASDLAADIEAYTDEVSGLIDATAYSYQVCAVHTDGREGCSVLLNVTTASLVFPEMPNGDIRVENETPTSVDISWTNNDLSVTGYIIKHRLSTVTIDIPIDDAGTVQYRVTGLQSDTTYAFKICAINDDGMTCTSEFNGTTDIAPAKPTVTVPAVSITQNTLTLNWVDNAANETGYKIKQTQNGSTSFIFKGIDEVTHDLDSLSASTAYEYQVCAEYFEGETCSDIINVITNPETADNITVNDITHNSVRLAWNDTNTNESGYRIKRGGEIIAAALAVDASGYTDGTLDHSTAYTYQVCAFNAYGETCSAAPPVTTKIPPPADARVDSWTQDTVILAWTDDEIATGYIIIRDSAIITIPELGADVVAYTDTPLAHSTDYEYQVCALNGAEESCSVVLPVTTLIPKPAMPTNAGLTVDDDQGSVSLTWTDNAITGTGYMVKRNDGSNNVVFELADNEEEHTDSTLRGGIEYSYAVCAYNSGGESCVAIPDIVTISARDTLVPIYELLFN